MLKRWLLVAATALAAVTIAVPSSSAAVGRFHGHIVIRGVYAAPYGPWWGYFGFGPYGYWGPYYGPYWGQADYMAMAATAGIGAVDLNVKPGSAEVWVDGAFVAEAHDLDGSPNLLWLREGPHHIVIYKGGYQRFEQDVMVPLGRKMDVKIHLQEGSSQPPGTRPRNVS